ncbi:MAG: amidohydrolase family protein [Dehalococcoidia bacterium]
MEIKFGLISADSHVVFDRNAIASRMSATKWGDRIPQVVEREVDGKLVHRWSVYGKTGRSDVANCPAVMGDPFPTYPQRLEDVPKSAYDPLTRLQALDADGVDAEVLFPNPPVATFLEYGDREFELEATRAYNDALSEWRTVSDRYLPLALVPYLSGPEEVAKEIERAVENGHHGINLLGQMPESLPHLADPHWYPIWDACAQLGVPVHFHGSANLRVGASAREWSGYSPRQAHSAFTSTSAVTPAQIIPQLIFSGVTERFPGLTCVFAEAGIGGFNYVLAACDHEWETRHLWTEGIGTRPSETVRKQMYVNFWFEEQGIKLRHNIGIENIMWESDFPHVASFYPRSWESVERVLEGVPADDRRLLLYENAMRVYRIEATVPA